MRPQAGGSHSVSTRKALLVFAQLVVSIGEASTRIKQRAICELASSSHLTAASGLRPTRAGGSASRASAYKAEALSAPTWW